MKYLKRIRKFLITIICVILIGYLIPEGRQIPVEGATVRDWNSKSFWYSPWGRSGVHKGIDIFAQHGTYVSSATNGLVIFTGENPMGGNVVLVLGPKWRLHYYAHLGRIDTFAFAPLHSGEILGTVGDTGNAKGKPPHLHYAIFRLIPDLFAIENGPQGARRMWYVNPDKFLRE